MTLATALMAALESRMLKTLVLVVFAVTLFLMLESVLYAASVADGQTLEPVNVEATPTPVATAAPTPAPTEVVPPCGPDGMPVDPSKPCLLLVNPMAALGVKVTNLQTTQGQIIQAIQNLQGQINELKGGGTKPKK